MKTPLLPLQLPAILAAATLLCGGARAAAPAVPLPELTVSKTMRVPIIDGKTEPGEWDQAAACTAFVEAQATPRLSHLQSVAYITYDDTYIYVCLKNLRGAPHTLLKASGRRPDDENIVYDHSNEIWITPPSSPQRTYQTLFNVYPGVLDILHIPSMGYTAKAWKGNWEFSSSQATDSWLIEARAPIRSFEQSKIENGAKWKGLFTTDILGDGDKFRAWAAGGGFVDVERHGILNFSESSPVFQLLNVETVFTGKATFPAAVAGPASGKAKVFVTARFGGALEPSAEDKQFVRSFEVAAGQREPFNIEADLTTLQLPLNKAGHPVGFCEITAKTESGTLYHQVFPFAVDGFVRTPPVAAKLSPYETAFGLMASYAPLNRKLLVKVDRFYLANRADAISGSARLVDPETKKVVIEQPIAPFAYDYSEFVMDLSALKVPIQTESDWAQAKPLIDENAKISRENVKRAEAGEELLPLKELPGVNPAQYQLEVRLTDAAGSVLESAAQPVKLISYEFEWLPNEVGISDKVIAPWTPVKWKDGVVSLWNKTYEMDGLGLAKKITNAGAPQLTGPMRMLATIDGKEQELAAGMPRLGAASEAGVTLNGTATASSIDVSVETRVEFDGFVLNTMKVSPKAGASLDRLSLVVTMPKAEAPCFVTTAGGWAAYHGWTPEKWDSRETSSGSLAVNFVPYIFLTDSDRGFCWFADNTKGWELDPAQPTQTLTTTNDTVTVKVNFVTKAVTDGRPCEMRWGWAVSPQKPQQDGWRSYVISSSKPNPLSTAIFWNNADWAVLWPYYSSPFPKDYAKSAEILTKARAAGQSPFVGNIAHAIARYQDYKGRKFDELAADWADVPGRLRDGNVARSRGPNDFQLWHFSKWIEKSGLSGLYFDENYLGEDFNFLTGGAYLLPDSSVEPGYSYLGLREFNIRLRHLFASHDVPAPNLWLHTTGGQPIYAWFPDVSMEAENVEPTTLENDYPSALPASRLRSIGMGRNLGSAPFIMCQADRHWIPSVGPALVHQFAGWVLMHDCLPEGLLFWSTLSGELEMWREDLKFVPYWKAGSGVESSAKDVIASAHVAAGQGVVWVFNLDRRAQRPTVKLDLAKLGFAPSKTLARDLETGADLALENGALTLDIPARHWRAIRLHQPALLTGTTTFTASFDKQGRADESLGSPLPRGASFPELVEGMKGQAISLQKSVTFETRHHLQAGKGSVEFQIKLSQPKVAGTLFAIGSTKLTIGAGKVSLADAGRKIAASGVLPEDLAPGWHAINVAWAGNEATVSLDGKEILRTALADGMPIPAMGRGLDIVDSRRKVSPVGVAFGPFKDAALDNLKMGR